MGDDILILDQAKMTTQLFKKLENNDPYMLKLFKSVYLNLQDGKPLDSLLKEIDPNLSLKPSKRASSRAQYPKLNVKIEAEKSTSIQDEIFSLISLKKEI